MNRSQLSIVQEHINQIGDREIEVQTKEETDSYPLYAVMQVETSRGFKNEYFVDIAHDEDDELGPEKTILNIEREIALKENLVPHNQ
jgi:hypothetical protein